MDTVKKAQNVKKRNWYETCYNSSSDSNKYGESVNRRIKVTQERLSLWGGGGRGFWKEYYPHKMVYSFLALSVPYTYDSQCFRSTAVIDSER